MRYSWAYEPLSVLALVVCPLHESRHPQLGAIELALEKSELAHTVGLDGQRRQTIRDASVLDRRAEDIRLDSPAQRTGARARSQELRVRHPGQLGESLAHHVVAKALQQPAPVVGDALLAFVARPLAQELHARACQLGIRRHVDEQLLVQWNSPIGLRCLRRTRGQRSEQHSYALLYLGRVDVADDDQSHELRPIPGVVEGTQTGGGGVAKHLRFANWQPLGVARTVEQHRKLLVPDSGPGAETAAPFLDDHASFLVDFGRIERQAAGEVGHRRQALGDDVRLVARQFEHVDGFVEARIRIHVRAKTGSDGFERRNQLARLEVRAAVERHVLDEMRQALLVVRLIDRSRLDGEPERHSLGGLLVMPNENLQPVRKRGGADRRVEGDDILGIRGWLAAPSPRPGERKRARRRRQGGKASAA